MKRTLFLKVFGGFFLIIVLLTALFLLTSFRTVKKHYLDGTAHHLESLGEALKPEIIAALEEGRVEDLRGLVERLGKAVDIRFTVVDGRGVVLADSDDDPLKMESHRFRPEITEALRGGVGRSIRFSTTVKEEMLYVGLPLEKEGRVLGVLRVSEFLKDIDPIMSGMRRNITGTVLIVMFISLIGAYFLTRSLTRPVKELMEASRKVAGGDFRTRVHFRERNEWGDLAGSFNAMTERIQTLFADVRKRSEELQSIISSMQDGLMAVDRDGKIFLSNRSFHQMVRSESVEGKYYWEVVREPGFGELIKKVKEGKRGASGEITLSERVFLCGANYLISQDAVICTFHDLTEMKNIEKIKKDIVMNVSHELRTPLTAIKGFVETLEGEVEEKNRNYLEIIKRHTNRLINIVEDLLVLSELEEKSANLEFEDVDVKKLAENILKIFLPDSREKGIDLRLVAGDDLPPVKADPCRLEQMLINLIDNALKYTEKGEVVIDLTRGQGELVLEIKDTGIGILREHLPRIFERFYVVDKSRSRKLGGTGLGLSIVKHIVLLHNGRIQVESTPGAGTSFLITLPASSA